MLHLFIPYEIISPRKKLVIHRGRELCPIVCRIINYFRSNNLIIFCICRKNRLLFVINKFQRTYLNQFLK